MAVMVSALSPSTDVVVFNSFVPELDEKIALLAAPYTVVDDWLISTMS